MIRVVIPGFCTGIGRFRRIPARVALFVAIRGHKQVGFRPSAYQVHGVKSGLQWFRCRQRSLARGVLALFCAAWLQAAIVPCVMAHASREAPPSTAQHAHGAAAGHDHGAMPGMHHADGEPSPCIYCPPADAEHGSCDGHGCAFPHDPQMDARAASVLFSAVPLAFVLPTPGTVLVAARASPVTSEAIPRVPLSVSYCRFIE
jgi:hypothetical protein